MKKTWKPIIAGILMLLACVPYVIASIRWYITPGFLPDNLGGGPIWAPLGFILLIPFGLPLLSGAICAMVRRAWGLAFLGAVTPLVFTVLLTPWGWTRVGIEYVVQSQPPPIRLTFTILVYLMMVAAAILLFLSRKEFKGRKSSTEHLFSPPKKLRDMISE
jgi:hypothetical protein